jgi:hypothetical protein
MAMRVYTPETFVDLHKMSSGLGHDHRLYLAYVNMPIVAHQTALHHIQTVQNDNSVLPGQYAPST